jgi:hypothetical protein
MKLQLKAKHYYRSRFGSNCNCAISKAAKEQFNRNTGVKEYVDELHIGKTIYTHKGFHQQEFNVDHEKARNYQYDDRILRTIILKEKK